MEKHYQMVQGELSHTIEKIRIFYCDQTLFTNETLNKDLVQISP